MLYIKLYSLSFFFLAMPHNNSHVKSFKMCNGLSQAILFIFTRFLNGRLHWNKSNRTEFLIQYYQIHEMQPHACSMRTLSTFKWFTKTFFNKKNTTSALRKSDKLLGIISKYTFLYSKLVFSLYSSVKQPHFMYYWPVSSLFKYTSQMVEASVMYCVFISETCKVEQQEMIFCCNLV